MPADSESSLDTEAVVTCSASDMGAATFDFGTCANRKNTGSACISMCTGSEDGCLYIVHWFVFEGDGSYVARKVRVVVALGTFVDEFATWFAFDWDSKAMDLDGRVDTTWEVDLWTPFRYVDKSLLSDAFYYLRKDVR